MLPSAEPPKFTVNLVLTDIQPLKVTDKILPLVTGELALMLPHMRLMATDTGIHQRQFRHELLMLTVMVYRHRMVTLLLLFILSLTVLAFPARLGDRVYSTLYTDMHVILLSGEDG